jgi:excisionase family DNA binding protein
MAEAGAQEKVSGRFLSITEVCERLAVSRPVVDAMIHDGKLPHVKIGRRLIRVPVEALERMAEETLAPK